MRQPAVKMYARGISRYCIRVCQIGCFTGIALSDLEGGLVENGGPDRLCGPPGRPLRARVTSAAAAPLGMHACSSRVSSRSFARPVTQYDALHAVFRTMQMFVGNIYRAGA